jgi:hypothetical protein
MTLLPSVVTTGGGARTTVHTCLLLRDPVNKQQLRTTTDKVDRRVVLTLPELTHIKYRGLMASLHRLSANLWLSAAAAAMLILFTCHGSMPRGARDIMTTARRGRVMTQSVPFEPGGCSRLCGACMSLGRTSIFHHVTPAYVVGHAQRLSVRKRLLHDPANAHALLTWTADQRTSLDVIHMSVTQPRDADDTSLMYLCKTPLDAIRGGMLFASRLLLCNTHRRSAMTVGHGHNRRYRGPWGPMLYMGGRLNRRALTRVPMRLKRMLIGRVWSHKNMRAK